MTDNPRLVWLSAIIVAAIGAWIMFDAMPGVNWALWTAAASVGLAVLANSRGILHRSTLVMLGTATLLAVGAGVTADPVMHAFICLSVMLFLALAMLLSVDPGFHRITAFFVVSSPFIAGGTALGESFTRVVEATALLRSSRARAAVRGTIITVPVLVVFALLLAAADPTFAAWRDEIGRIIETWSFIPRTIFFLVMLTIVLGAYSFAARTPALLSASRVRDTTEERRWLGATERVILISAVTALLWLFIGVQLSYLFGNVPTMPGSDISFAEYAQRGFGELTIVATLSVVLILVSERFGRLNGRAGLLKALTIALLVAVFIILMSAFYRVRLYEAAYGYTVSRLYAQTYMFVLATALFALMMGVVTVLDTGILFRRVFTMAVFAFAVLVFWNHEAWIASANIDRYAGTGKLDTKYIVNDLSPNAVPVIVARLASLPEPIRTELHDRVVERYRNPRILRPDRWFEWNYRREQARAALAPILSSASVARP